MRLVVWLEERLGAWTWHLLWFFWRMVLFLALCGMALLSMMLVLLETPLGTRYFLEQMLGWHGHVHIRWHAGSLDDHLILDRLDWQARTFHVHAESIQLDSKISSLIHGQWPLAHLEIGVLELDYPYSKPHVTILQSLWMPWILDLNHGQIHTIRINRAGKVDAGYRLDVQHVRWQGHQLVLQGATLQHSGIPSLLRLHLSGMVQLYGSYPVLATGWMGWPELELKGMQPWRLDLAGSVEHLRIWTETLGGAVPVHVSGSIWSTQPYVPYDLKGAWHDVVWPWQPGAALRSSSGVLQVQGTLNGYQAQAFLQLTGRHVPQGAYQFSGEGDWHQLHLHRLIYQGLGGTAQGNADLAWQQASFRWRTDLDAQHVQWSQQWPYMSTVLPVWQGHWQSSGQAGLKRSQWQVSGLNQAEHWQISGEVSDWFTRLDRPYHIKVQVNEMRRQPIPTLLFRIRQANFELNGSWDQYLWSGTAKIASIQKNELREADVHLTMEGTGQQTEWQANRLDWSSPHVQAHFDGKLSHSGRWEIDGTLDLHKLLLQPWWANAPDQLTGTSHVKLRAGQGNLQELVVQDLQGQGRHGDQPVQIQLNSLSIPLTSRLKRFDVSQLRVSTAAESFLFLDGTWDSNTRLLLRTEHWPLDLLLAQTQGQVSGTVTVQGNDEYPDIKGDLQLQQVSFGPWSAHQANFTLNLKQLGEQDSQATVSIAALSHTSHALGDLAFQVKGQKKAHQWLVDWHPGLALAVKAEGIGGWHGEEKSYLGQISLSHLFVGGVAWDDSHPVALTVRPALLSATLAPTCWQHAEARFCLDEATTLEQSRSIRISLHQLAATDVPSWLPDGLSWQGAVNGQADLLWAKGQNPVSHLDIQSGHGSLLLGQDQSDPLRVPFEDIHLHAELGQGQFVAQTDLDAAGKGKVQAQGTINLQSRMAHGTVDIQQMDMQTFQAFFPQLSELKGNLFAHAIIDGLMQQPVVQGTVAVRQGEVQSRDHEIHIRDIELQGQLTPSVWTAQANFKTKHGQGTLTDQTDWAQGQWKSVVNLDMSGLSLDRLPLLSSSIDAHLRATLMPYSAHVDGRVQLQSADILMQDRGASSLKPSDDTVDVGQHDPNRAINHKWSVDQDIRLELGRNVRFRGFNVDGHLSGSVTAHQSTGQSWSVHGEIDLDPEASFQAYGQNLRIRKGRIIFLGPVKTPQIDVEAIKNFDPNVVVGVKVEGWADRLSSTLISDNQLSQDEISSYLIFGHAPERQQALFGINNSLLPAGSIPGMGAPVSGGKLAALQAGALGGQKVADTLGQAIGVRDLSLSTQGVGTETQMALGGYIAPELYISYGVGVFTPVNSLTLRYRLNQRMYLEASSAFQNAVDLFYTWGF